MSGIFPKRSRLRRSTDTELDFTVNARIKQTLTANTTFSRIFGGEDGEELTFFVQQDGTGNRTVTWPTAVVWMGGSAPTLDTEAIVLNIIKFWKFGATYIGQSTTASAAAAALANGNITLSADL